MKCFYTYKNVLTVIPVAPKQLVKSDKIRPAPKKLPVLIEHLPDFLHAVNNQTISSPQLQLVNIPVLFGQLRKPLKRNIVFAQKM